MRNIRHGQQARLVVIARGSEGGAGVDEQTADVADGAAAACALQDQHAGGEDGQGASVSVGAGDGRRAAGADGQAAVILESAGGGEIGAVLEGEAGAGGVGGQGAGQALVAILVDDLESGAVEQEGSGVRGDGGPSELEHPGDLVGAAGEGPIGTIG